MSLEIAGVSAAFICLTTAMIAVNLMTLPEDMFLLVFGWMFMAWFSACLGTILGCLSEHYELVERLWHPLSYFMLAISGTFFMVDWLPSRAQELISWVPMVHPVEMMRAGYWGTTTKPHYSWPYITTVCLSMTLVALALMSDKRLKNIT